MIEFIDREIGTTVSEASKYFSVICITGPRQSGKSTLIQYENDATDIKIKSFKTGI